MNPPAGWLPDPGGQPGQRYFDGQRWTEHFAPTPPTPPPPPSVAVAVSSGGGPNHALHAVLTLFTCGMWLPVWILIAIFSGSSRSSVAVAGNGMNMTTPPNRKPLIVACVVLGWIMLGASVEHPWLLAVLVVMGGVGGLIWWMRKDDQNRARRERDEQVQRDIIAGRADYENKLYYEGDPRGTYGQYMPPPDQGGSA
jgi:hypothetical protein